MSDTMQVDEREAALREKEKHADTLLADVQAKHRAACDLEKERAGVLALQNHLVEKQDQLNHSIATHEKQKRQYEQEQAKREEALHVREAEAAKKQKELEQKQLEYERSKRNLDTVWAEHTQRIAELKKLLGA